MNLEAGGRLLPEKGGSKRDQKKSSILEAIGDPFFQKVQWAGGRGRGALS